MYHLYKFGSGNIALWRESVENPGAWEFVEYVLVVNEAFRSPYADGTKRAKSTFISDYTNSDDATSVGILFSSEIRSEIDKEIFLLRL